MKVCGVHPTGKHDIPGVRSLPQLKVTQHYNREAYDELAEVTNEEAFDMCVRLNREESIIAGPSSGMQVVGALRLMKDEPGNVGVVIFCDDIFKYATSVTRNCPSVFPDGPGPGTSPEAGMLQSVLDSARDGPDTLGMEALVRLAPVLIAGDEGCPKIVDVRPREEFESRLRPLGAVNIPAARLMGKDGGIEARVTQVFEGIPGAVQRRPPTTGEPPSKRPRAATVLELLRASPLGEVALDCPLLLI